MGHIGQQKLFIKDTLAELAHWLPRENTHFAGKSRSSSIGFFMHTRYDQMIVQN